MKTKKIPEGEKWFKVLITAPDGRFGTKTIEGGLTKKSAEFEANYYKEKGMIVRILPTKN